jgi:hypothetical protein
MITIEYLKFSELKIDDKFEIAFDIDICKICKDCVLADELMYHIICNFGEIHKPRFRFCSETSKWKCIDQKKN